ncbi:MAG: class I SAM-dependent methyltransferase [Planctomycetota bacterium]
MTARPGQEISAAHVASLSATDLSGYWWHTVRLAHVRAALAQLARSGELRYLDLGCGTGGALAAVQAALRPAQALGLDGTQQAVDIAVARGLPVRLADFRKPLDLPFAPNAVTCLDVLEHLEDPELALRHLAQAAAPWAALVVTVPAMPSLHSRWDDLCGHHRRYTRALLTAQLLASGWRPVRLRHIFSYCVPPAWWQRRVLRRVQEVEFPAVSPLMNRALIWAGGLERVVGAPLPFGTSLLAVARRC